MEASEDEDEFVQQNDHQNDHQQQYSFEEQFKQLYELSADPKRKEFLDDLFLFMTKRGTAVNRIPIMAKQVLDLYELYRAVVARGGLVEVINKKIWREITKGLNLPSSITSAAFTLRTQYMKYLYPYECDRENLSTPEELQQAIDGNRREGRRSSNGHYSDMGESSIEAGSSGVSVGLFNGGASNGGPSNGGPSNGGPSNGRPTNGGLSSLASLASLGLTAAQPLSLVKRNSTATNSGASSGEEDNVSIHSLSHNPLLALASAQPEALNLQVKPNKNERQIELNSSSLNKNKGNTGSAKVNGSTVRHSPSLSTSPSPSPSSSSSSSTLHNQGMKRNLPEDQRILINAGMPSIHVKLTKSEGGDSTDNSLLINMEINNTCYTGVLFPQIKQK